MRVILAFLISTQYLYAGFERSGYPAKGLALANACTGIEGNVWTLIYNVGGLATIPRLQCGVSYNPGWFNLRELGNVSAAIGLPTPAGSFGLVFRRYGYAMYYEQSFGTAYAIALSAFRAGLSLWYHSVHIERYGTGGAVAVDFGFQVLILSGLNMGITASNVNSPVIGCGSEVLPQVITAGLSYQALNDLTLFADVKKETNFPPYVRLGIEYCFMDLCAVRAGISSESVHYSVGIGIRHSVFQFDYGIAIHRILGETHVVSVSLM